MEQKVMRQKSFPSEYLDDMLLASFLNDEYDELQEDVQENVFGFQVGANKNECVEQEVQENECDLKRTENERSHLSLNSISVHSSKHILEELNAGNSILKRNVEVIETKRRENERSHLSSNSISVHSSKHMLEEEINAGNSIPNKRNVEVIETKNVKDSETNISSTEGSANEKLHYDECHLEGLPAEGNTLLTRRKIGILAREQKTITCNEVSNSNGPILQNGPMNTTESVKTSITQDDRTQLQSDHTFINTEKGNCKDNFLMSIKICFVILFVSLLYYFLTQGR